MKTNQQISDKPRYCKAVLNLSISPETIPNLVPQKKLDIIMANDENPYIVIEEIADISQPANGIYYSVEFWESYLKKLKKRPIPGSKDGHNTSYMKTPPNDIYTIGGEIKKNKVFLKVYIPPDGALSSNHSFIRDLKSGLIHFSIVSWTKDNIELDENGYISKITAVESVRGERNDAVEYGMGSMDQKVNKDDVNHLKNKDNEEVYLMPENVYADIIKNLCNQIDNGGVTKKNIAKDLGIEIVTEEHTNAVKLVSDIKNLIGDDPLKRINSMIENEEAVKNQAYTNKREELMTAEFGPEKLKENGKEIDNLKRQAAELLVKKENQSIEDLEKEISAAKENSVVKKFSFEEADITTETNTVTQVKSGDNVLNSEVVEV